MLLPCLAMAHLPRLLLFFLLILLGIHASGSHGSPLLTHYNTPICSKSYPCGGVEISYPFYLTDVTGKTYDNTSFSCGYPGLNISCSWNSGIETATIQLNGSSYTVRNISYSDYTVVLVDTDALGGGKCPRVRHNVSVDEEWLHYSSSRDNLTFFFGCNLEPTDPLAVEREKDRIVCKGFSNSPVPGPSFVVRSGELNASAEHELAAHCSQTIVVPVLGDFPIDPTVLSDIGYGEVHKKGFELVWNSAGNDARCNRCEQSQGKCAYNQSRTFLGCSCSDGKVAVDSPYCPRPGDSSLKRKKKLYIVAGTSSVFLLCLLFFACLFGLKKYRSRCISKGTPRIESFLQRNRTLHPKRYSYREVKRMTKSFDEKLGQGGFGAVYRGHLSDGYQVAVKMLKDSKGDGEEFINEVASISRTSHVNVVTLLGFCLQGSKRALIYEYMSNGSLERYAFNKNSKGKLSLTWEKLFDIAVGIARGLEYLHRGCNTRIVHFDIKPHNILLDQDFCPKISDFGMAKLCANKESIISIGGARGTIGYIAPEVYSKQFGAISSKSDVYSYGMMVLEMVGARERNIDANSEFSSNYFPQWVYEHLDEYCISSNEINGESTELVRKMLVVGLWCIQVIPTNRSTMTRVVEMLEGSTSGLGLPPKLLLSL